MKAEDFTLDAWDEKCYSRLVKFLQNEAEEEYRQFSEKLIPDCREMFGVRVPKLRVLAKCIAQGNWREYLCVCQNDTFEEIVLRGAVIGLVEVSFEALCALADSYVPLIDNWAVCDYFCGGLKRVKKFEKEFLPKVFEYLDSDNPWIRRAGLVLLRSHYVKKEYIREIPKWAERTLCAHYYVQMAHAWLLAECYAKFPLETHDYLANCELGAEVVNKTVQKIRESNRVDREWKEKASAFRIKN